MNDLIIKNGSIISAEGAFRSDIEIRQGKIYSIGQNLEAKDAQVIDAENKLILPGVIDGHVHFEEQFAGRIWNADNFESGTQAAASGGVTTVIDFTSPQQRSESLVEAFQRRRQQADPKVVVDYALHSCFPGGLTPELLAEMKKMKNFGVPSFKVFTLGEDLGLDQDEIYAIMQQAVKLGVMVNVHAEDGGMIEFLEEQLLKYGKTTMGYFALSRPNSAEAGAVQKRITLNEQLKGKLYFVHLSTAESVDLLRSIQSHPGHVFGETCPQYLLLDDQKYELDNGEQYVIAPPLRDAGNQDQLWKGIAEGLIQVVGTDHCPFLKKHKQGKRDFTQVPRGLGGVELLLPLMYSEGVVKKNITINLLVQSLSTNPAKIFGMYPQKGTISLKSDADLVIFDPRKTWRVSAKQMFSRADFSPYESLPVTGKVEMTISRGEIIYRDGEVLGKAGRGQFIQRGTDGDTY